MTREATDGVARLDAVKGLLIFCIVYGHARIVHDFGGAIVGFLYLWHVQSFFLLAALEPRPLTRARAGDVAVRYLVPFVWIVTGLVGVAILRGKAPGLAVEQWLQALWFGSGPYLGAATEASVYWFLPSFLCVSLLLSALVSLPRAFALALALVVTIIGIARGVFDIPLGTIDWPVGSGLVFYLVTEALLFAGLWRLVRDSRALQGAALLVAIAALAYAALFWATRPPLVNVALYRFPDDTSTALLTMLLPPVVLTGVMVAASATALQRLFGALGRRSLLIYLFHQPILFPMWLALKKISPPPFSFWPAVSIGLVMALVAIGVAVLIGEAIWRTPWLKRLLLPAGWSEFRSAFSPKRTAR